MLMGLVVSIGLISIGKLSPGFTQSIKDSLLALDFSEFILGIVLIFLLFAGSLHVKLDDIKASAKSIFSFATIAFYFLRVRCMLSLTILRHLPKVFSASLQSARLSQPV